MTEQMYVHCYVPVEDVTEHLDWTECAAFKFRANADGTATLLVTNDLERITDPGESV